MLSSGDAPLIKDIVKKVISDIGGSDAKTHRISEEEINRFWKNAAGKFASRRSIPTSLRRGRLLVAVGDSSLFYDLTIRKREILGALEKELGGRIQDIQFRIGDISEGKRKKEKGKRY